MSTLLGRLMDCNRYEPETERSLTSVADQNPSSNGGSGGRVDMTSSFLDCFTNRTTNSPMAL